MYRFAIASEPNQPVKLLLHFIRLHFELICWVAAIILLALSDPTQDHFSFCVFRMVGLDFCPGCGLGHSIAWLFRLNFERSIECHLLGIPALLILLFRIFQLIKTAKLNYDESKITFTHSWH